MPIAKKQHMTVAERQAAGREARRAAPRTAHGSWTPAADRPDPIALLLAQDEDRMEDLVPIRWGRMSASPFAFYRGSAALMAADLAPLPRTDLTVQLCGDAHLANFGMYGSPERELLFDVNDFDETLPGPFEWDLKRLAASFVIATRHNGLGEDVARETALAAARSYRQHMASYAEMRELDVWYSRVVADDLLQMARAAIAAKSGAKSGTKADVKSPTKAGLKMAEKGFAKARGRDSLQAAGKLTEVVDGVRRIVDQPPLIMHLDMLNDSENTHRLFEQYKATLEDDRRVLLERFQITDIARKVVGVGSVGTRCIIVLLLGRDGDDPLFLQIKEAGPSVLEPYLGRSKFTHAGHRVVAGQRLMQAASDIFLGWMTGKPAGRPFYWRQLRDMKGSVDTELLKAPGLEILATLCGWALARGHARSGRRIAIASYLGVSDRFDQAIADFAQSYANQAEKDYETLTKAIKQGKIPVESGI
ncbi:MAG: DUF2252 domain-containing protein [Actinobacteria bacterium]|nr:DUF2252 domain-containing protein [Actinomycetota bacterium]